MFCSEHLESVHGGAKARALGSNKTCAQVFEGLNEVWSEISWRWEVKMQEYSNSDWAGSATDKKSTLGCCFSLGSTMIS
jgi:hypothetical protein